MIKIKRMIQKAMILRYRVFKIPVLMVFGRNTIKVIYGKNNKYLSFNESMYYTSLLESIEHTTNLTGKKPVIIKV